MDTPYSRWLGGLVVVVAAVLLAACTTDSADTSDAEADGEATAAAAAVLDVCAAHEQFSLDVQAAAVKAGAKKVKQGKLPGFREALEPLRQAVEAEAPEDVRTAMADFADRLDAGAKLDDPLLNSLRQSIERYLTDECYSSDAGR